MRKAALFLALVLSGGLMFNTADAALTKQACVHVAKPHTVTVVKGKCPQGYMNLVGPQGASGLNGTNGTNGVDGASAYDLAVQNGFTGTEQEWLNSLAAAPASDPLVVTTYGPTSIVHDPQTQCVQCPASPTTIADLTWLQPQGEFDQLWVKTKTTMETDQWGCNTGINVTVNIELNTTPDHNIVKQYSDGVSVGNPVQHIVALGSGDYPLLWSSGSHQVMVWATYGGSLSPDCMPTVAVTIARQYAAPA